MYIFLFAKLVPSIFLPLYYFLFLFPFLRTLLQSIMYLPWLPNYHFFFPVLKAWVKGSTCIPIFDVDNKLDAGTLSRHITTFVMGIKQVFLSCLLYLILFWCTRGKRSHHEWSLININIMSHLHQDSSNFGVWTLVWHGICHSWL